MNSIWTAPTTIHWLRFLPPTNSDDLLIDQTGGAFAYGLIALVLGVIRRIFGRPFNPIALLRAIVAGAGLPVAAILACSPFFPEVTSLLTEQTMRMYLMVAGTILVVLSIYGLIR